MFKVYENGKISYRGVMLDTNDPKGLSDVFDRDYFFKLPLEYLEEIDARDIPDIEYVDVHCLLPGAKSIISSKCPEHYLRVKEINEKGVKLLIGLSTNVNDWNEPISPDMFFTEIQAIFDNKDNLELEHIHFDPSEFDYSLEYLLDVPSFNLREIYDAANNLLIDVEEHVYKKILKMAIGNLRTARKNYKD